jgi:hypothetical protein
LASVRVARWHSPVAFVEVVEKWDSKTPKEVFLGGPGGSLREAWVLAEFVKLTEVDRVRLSDPDELWPDGYVEIGGEIKSIEITEVMELTRRRGDELKNPGPAVQMDPGENWVARAEAIPAALRAAVERKVKKRYGSSATLLVYLNISEWGIRQKETEQIIAEVKAEHASSFEQIVVL